MLIVRSTSLDPYWNLAVEEYLLGELDQYNRILFLWQSDRTVVIGKNQNPWRECRMDRLRKDRGLLARRLSGGGAVYHDRGNVNYTVIQPREGYSEDTEFGLLQAALRKVGVESGRMGRTSLAVGQRKISGNAFCFRRNVALHHGTLLVSTNLGHLESYLEPSGLSIRTRAVSSQPAPVVNLADLADVTVEHVMELLADTFGAAWHTEPIIRACDFLDQGTMRELHHKYISWDWCFGQTPPFETQLEEDFSWGKVCLEIHVVKGMIARANVESEALDGADMGHLEGELLDCPYKPHALARRVKNCIGRDGHALLEEVADWLHRLPLT